jgi:hypothetical protein
VTVTETGLRYLSVLLSLCAMLAACTVMPRSSGTVSGPAGTYEIAVCRTSCSLQDTAAAYAVGWLILLDDPNEAENLNYRHQHKNGCFDFPKLLPLTDTFLQKRGGRVAWASDSTGAIRFLLFTTADAGYGVRVRIVNGVLEGTGISSGAGVAAIPNAPRDYIVGRRTGPPDRSRCGIDLQPSA